MCLSSRFRTSYMITKQEVLMGREKEFPLTQEMETNLEKLLSALNKFRSHYGAPMLVSSGYRPEKFNTAAGGAKASNHMKCLACDFKDPSGVLAQYCLANLDILKECGLYLESPAHTKGWVHLQAVPPKSGNRVFIP